MNSINKDKEHRITRFVRLNGVWEQAIIDPHYQRVITRTASELWQSGLNENGQYKSDKWSGKYFRAPDIYFRILERCADKLVRLGDIADIRRGFTTGANEFFFLKPVNLHVSDIFSGKAGTTVRVANDAGWAGEIETEWLQPLVKSPRELKTLRVYPEDLRYLVFMPPNNLSTKLEQLVNSKELQHRYPKVWEYIQWGEKQGYHNNIHKSKQLWWKLSKVSYSLVLIPEFFRRFFRIIYNPYLFPCDHTFYLLYGLSKPEDALLYAALLNTSLTYVSIDITGRTNDPGLISFYGTEWKGLLIPRPSVFTAEQQERLRDAFEQISNRKIHNTFEELGLPKPNRDYSNIHVEDVSLERVPPDRRALDTIVFEALELTEQEQLEVYRTVVELVKNRLAKAKSL